MPKGPAKAAGAAPAKSVEELQREVAQVAAQGPLVATEEPEADQETAVGPSRAGDPREAEEWTFDFRHETNRGEVYAGTFTNRILTVGEQQESAALAARMSGGVPFESLDPTTSVINEAVAHLAYSLWDVDRSEFRGPAWAKDLRKVFDLDVITALWVKVQEHERAFFRMDPDAEKGSKASR